MFICFFFDLTGGCSGQRRRRHLKPVTLLRVSILATNKQRLDRLLVERGIVPSRQRAQAMIMAGKVLVNNRPVDKAGFLVGQNDDIE